MEIIYYVKQLNMLGVKSKYPYLEGIGATVEVCSSSQIEVSLIKMNSSYC